jgi:hypothetical protein
MDPIVPAPRLGTASAGRRARRPALDLERFIRRTVAPGAASPDTVAGKPARSAPVPRPLLGPAWARNRRGPPPATWRNTGANWLRREYTPLTIGAKLTALRRLLAAAVDAGVLLANPAEEDRAPRTAANPAPPPSAR